MGAGTRKDSSKSLSGPGLAPAEMEPPVAARVSFPLLRLGAIAFAALLIHGYHMGVEDGEIYIPAAKKLLHPGLYPFAPEFFLNHERLSIFGHVVAGLSQVTRMPIDWSIFVWYVVCLFGMVCATWMLASACFTSERARWSATLVFAAVMTMPATNTALLLVDPYLTARSFSTPLTLVALASLLQRRFVLAGAVAVVTGLFHPQMVAYLVVLAVIIELKERGRTRRDETAPRIAAGAAGALPTGFQLGPATGAYREALYTRDYYFLYNWEWYHWLGLLAPLAILGWFWRGKLRGTTREFPVLSFAMIPFGLVSIAGAAVVSSSPVFDNFVRLQPLRSFHLITIVFVLLLAGVFGEYAGRRRPWAIGLLAGGLATGMFFVGRATYPDSAQVEVPSATSSNAWVNTLLWIRHNTPQDAVFAVDADYMLQKGVDSHGFRAGAERSALADAYKDSGAASLFPTLAAEWKQMSEATAGLNHFTMTDFDRLKQEYPQISWTVIHGSGPSGLECPYRQQGYSVCRIR